MGYLDQTGLTHFWTKIKAALNRKQDRLIPDETVLIKDGGISVKTPVKPLTKAAYDGLSKEEKQAEAVYLVDEPPWTPIPLSIQEYDTEDGWHVRKWSDGYCELSCIYEHNVTSWTQGAAIWFTNAFVLNTPLPLISSYSVSVAPIRLKWVWLMTGDIDRSFVFVSNIPRDNGIYKVSIYITGRWK